MTIHSQVSAFGALLLFQFGIEVNRNRKGVVSYLIGHDQKRGSALLVCC